LKLRHTAGVQLWILLWVLFTGFFCAGQDSSQPQMPAVRPSDTQPAQAAGQSQAQSQSQPQTQTQTTEDKKAQAAGNTRSGTSVGTTPGTSKDRLFFALPNFLTVENAGNVPPLTAGQKFKVVAQGSFDPVQIVWYAALSGISQAENSEPGFGQGWEAYGKRYGAYAADGTIENFFVGAVLPSVLHQDPRFFPKAEGSFFSRAEYAVTRIVITRSDTGRRQFNYSEVFGAATASAISTYSYHPHPGYTPGQTAPYIASDRTLRNTASVWGSQMGYDTITIVVKEFWPVIRGKIKKQPQ